MAEEIEISDRTKVTFVLPSGARIEASIREGELRVEAESKQLQISPDAPNVVKISAK